MPDYPGLMDGEIIEEMKNLEMMIALHKKAKQKGINHPIDAPYEIDALLDPILIGEAWKSCSYSTIRAEYAKSWMEYYSSIYGVELYYNIEQFSNFFNRD